MSKNEAHQAMENGSKVEAGTGEDHDTGRILEIDGDTATVAWDSGVRTPCLIDSLELV